MKGGRRVLEAWSFWFESWEFAERKGEREEGQNRLGFVVDSNLSFGFFYIASRLEEISIFLKKNGLCV